MKFEKINKDKIKVTLNSDDLSKNCIDFHSFMSNSDETHSLFLDVLDKAEKDYGFSTKNYNLKVETVALSDGNFILTITRALDSDAENKSDTYVRKKLRVNRKLPKDFSSSVVYKLSSFDDFCSLTNAIYTNPLIDIKSICKDSFLYSYNNSYYLVFKEINSSAGLKILFSLITEFATYVDSSYSFIAKLHENGKIIFEHNAIQNCIKYFV